MIVEVRQEYERWDNDEPKFVLAVRELPPVSDCRGGLAFERVRPRRSVDCCREFLLGQRDLRRRLSLTGKLIHPA